MGTKSEDTILIGEDEKKNFALIGDWPKVSVAVNSRMYKRLAVMEIT